MVGSFWVHDLIWGRMGVSDDMVGRQRAILWHFLCQVALVSWMIMFLTKLTYDVVIIFILISVVTTTFLPIVLEILVVIVWVVGTFLCLLLHIFVLVETCAIDDKGGFVRTVVFSFMEGPIFNEFFIEFLKGDYRVLCMNYC